MMCILYDVTSTHNDIVSWSCDVFLSHTYRRFLTVAENADGAIAVHCKGKTVGHVCVGRLKSCWW